MATANSALETNFNVDPYYDDYSEDKNFHRILFKPSFAVQARELTQLQTILQDQVSRFGYHTFKEGSEVAGGGQFLDNTQVLRVAASYGGTTIDVTDFEGQYARTRQSENLYYIKKAVASTETEDNLLYVSYVQRANTAVVSNTSTTPFASEVIDFSANNTLSGGIFFGSNTGAAQLVNGATRAVSANGLLYHVDDSIFFTKGFFVRTDRQSVALSTNTDVIKSVGFTVNEEIVNSTQDSTLLDPADGSFNYTAPGADRFKISLTLTSRDLDDVSAPSLSSTNYFEISRVSGTNIVRKTPAPNYNVLADVLAERTFDESGHYIVNGLDVRVANTAANNSNLNVNITPGKAYVKGYPVQTYRTITLEMPKARDTDTVTEQNMTALYGNYVFANTIATGLFDIADKVDLHANTTPTPGDKIGEAHIKNIEYFSGSGDDRVYKIFLYDVKITDPSLTFETTKCIVSPNVTSTTAQAQIHSTGRTSIDKVGTTTAGSNQLVLNNTSGVKKGQLVENASHLPARTTVSSVLFDTVTLSENALSTVSNTFTFSSTDLQETGFHRGYFELPNINVTNVTNVDYKFKRKFAAVSFTSGSATIQTLGGTERFSSGTGSLANENFFVVVKTGATGALANGENVNMTTGSRSVSTPTPTPGSPASAVINLDEAGFNGTADIIAAIDVTGDSRRVKTFANNTTKTFDPLIAGTKYSLGYSDVYKINAIYEGNSSAVTSNDSDVTTNFDFDNGQRDNFYDHATIKLKTGQANTTGKILVDFNRFATSGGRGFFVADSYPNYTTIPQYTNQRGEIVELRDVIDFRPIRSSNTSSNVYISTSKEYEDHQIVDSQTFEVELDYEYYLRRVHQLALDEEGNFRIDSGPSRLKNPPEPSEDPSSITLAKFRLNPYTYDETDLQVKINNNSRYTMKDIGNIDRRLERVEYYTALNLLETQINNKQFTDDNGNVQFKNGFLVDNFTGHSIGDVFNPDYNIAIDRQAGTLHAPFETDSAPLTFTSGTVTRTGDFITVPYSQVPYLTQNTASSTINVNPFQISTFIGFAKITPDRDIWVDFDTAPDVVVNDEGDLDHFRNLQSQAGTEWGNWKTVNTTTSGSRRITTKERTGTVSSIQIDERVVSETKNVISNVFYYFMRTRKVEFELSNMRPNTPIYVFMDGINISRYAAPSTISANTVEDVRYLTNTQREVITDENGSVTGFFFVPNDSNITRRSNTSITSTAAVEGVNIPVGTVPVFFTDNFVDTSSTTTYALANYTAQGSKKTEQTTRIMTKEYSLSTESVVENDQVVTTISTGGGGTTGGSKKYFIDTSATRDQALDNAGSNDTSLATTVREIYERVLGRAPDQAGFEYWVADVEDDSTPVNIDNLEQAIINAAGINAQNPDVCKWGADPLAQTFFIDELFHPKGIFVTAADLFFSTKDETLPVRIEIRPTENGFPSSTYTIPYSRVSKKPSEVNLASGTNLAPTKFTFDNPIHLPPGEYAIVVITDSLKYNVYRSVIGEQRLGTTEFITEQPVLGSLFKSQNARTWTPAQEEDLCFTLFKANFTTGTNYTATLTANNVGRYAYNVSSNTEGKFDITNIVVSEYSQDPEISSAFTISTKVDGGAVSSFVDILPNQDIFFDSPREITTNSDLRVQLTMRSTNRDISPYVDVSAVGASLIKNKINTAVQAATVPETNASGGSATAKYITRKVTLAEGFDATALRVYIDQNMPAGSSIKVYYKVINNNDDTQFVERDYVEMTRVQTDTVTNETLDEYTEYEYKVQDITYTEDGVTFNSFNQFAIKIVLLSDSTAAAPTARNLRVIAFA